eukprot:CAMPEP_0172719952 /NCGR_PEP_ID=MMETSP1074-20121228/75801_1 /TAXON_ID=2916 /ORGANISM="Ceratium fusus, Strain PA161109" /LENGTH=437 /DNA_ID=CAMNT_0013545363 /DNA_START=72 /DNA_END=1385 /DNA_ORIENTATION=-
MAFRRRSHARSGAWLLPLLFAVFLATVMVNCVTTFLVPSQGIFAQQRHLHSSTKQLAPQHVFAGSAPKLISSTLHDESSWETSLPVLVAATALAAAAGSIDSTSGEEKSADAAKEDKPESGSTAIFNKLKLPIFAGLWYFFNIQYNIQNKSLLKVFSATWAVSWIQLAAGIPIALLMWATGLVKPPKVTSSDLAKLAPVGFFHALGQVATVASLGAVAVSFTHVVKALEPAVNAIASALVLGQVFHPLVYASLAPVFLGVALASSAELSFTMFGFLTAMLSNFAFVARNVLSTKLGGVGDMGEDQTERKTNQLAILTIVATAVLFPIAMALPGGLRSIPSAWNAAIASGVPANKLVYMIAASGFHFFMYQLSSFWVLSLVQPITHSVLNTLKRVVVIVASVFVFRNPVTAQSAAGTCIAVGGILLYSFTKGYFSKKK